MFSTEFKFYVSKDEFFNVKLREVKMKAAKAMPEKMGRREKLMLLLKKKQMKNVMFMEMRATIFCSSFSSSSFTTTKGTSSVLFLFLLFILILFVL